MKTKPFRMDVASSQRDEKGKSRFPGAKTWVAPSAPSIWNALGTRAGGEVVSADAF